jgi:hypothetical protein
MQRRLCRLVRFQQRLESSEVAEHPTCRPGKRVEMNPIDIIRFGDHRRARWGVADQLAMMQQLGAIPAAPSA